MEDETRFRFNPVGAWTPDRHAIRFDVDTSDPTQSSSAAPYAEIAFNVSAR